MKEHTYKRVQHEGIRVLLSGALGDLLYLDGEEWLTDFVRDKRFQDAIQELRLQIHNLGLVRTLTGNPIRRLVRQLLNSMTGGGYSRVRNVEQIWLTQLSKKYLLKTRDDSPGASKRQSGLLSLWAAQDMSREIFNANRYGFEMRDPYRDRRLVEFVLGVPAYQLYRHGKYKYILRVAMKGILPELIRDRSKRTSLTPFFSRGVEREKNNIGAILNQPGRPYRKFVREGWLQEAWKSMAQGDRYGPELAVIWLCVSFDAWYKSSNLKEEGAYD